MHISSRSLVAVAFGAFALNLLRYLLLALPAFLLFHRRSPGRLASRRLGPGPASDVQARREVLYSLGTLAIFGLTGVLMYVMARTGVSQLYSDNRYGTAWFILSIPVMLIIHDTYFYWTHRFMHWKRVFKYVHRVHHLSHDPSPLAAYSFHPLEAVIEAGIAPLIALVLPVHRTAFLIFITFQLLMNVLGHLGFELYPRGFLRSPWGWIFNTTTHHHQHHQKTNWNFGLYFNVWDRLMGTNHTRYAETFAAATEGARVELPGHEAPASGELAPPAAR